MRRKYHYQKINNHNNNNDNQQQPRNNSRRRHYDSNNNQQYNNHDNRSNVRNRLGQRAKFSGGSSFQSRNRLNLQNNQLFQQKRDDDFFKVTIPHGQKYDETYIIRLLRENLDGMDDPTIFYNFCKGQGACTFYVNSQDKADSLRNLSRRIQTDRGQRLVILTQRSAPPNIQLNDQYMSIIKTAMSTCYDAQNHIMNISRFRECEAFRQNGIFIMLNRPNVLKNIIQMIKENAPETVAINLSDNRIQSLEPLKYLSNLHGLKALDLSKNKINNVDELDHIKTLDLIEMVLEGNPFVNNYQSTATYVSAIRSYFKNLKTLDKEDLPDQIGFDLGITENIPQTKCSFIPDENLKGFITGFLQEYYRMYDSESRQQLMVAYHDSATFTLSISQNNLMYKPNELALKESHNLLRIRDESQWVKMVKTSNIDIVSFLCKLPVTKHHLDSFQVDIPFFNKEFINVVVNGLFQETYKNNPLRSFCRTFFLTPHNNGFVIINEMFLISSPSMKQVNENKHLIEQASSSTSKNDQVINVIKPSELLVTTNVLTNQSTATFASSASSSSFVNQEREEIIRKFKEATNMNRNFSIQCLEENGFNPAVAYEVFMKLKLANALPAEAFIE